MAGFVNIPDSRRYRCTRCGGVKDKSYLGNKRLGADTSNIPLLCQDCGQQAHIELTQHHYRCDICLRSLPATQDHFGNTSRKAKAVRHVCRDCDKISNLQDQFSSEEMLPIDSDDGEDFFGVPDGASEDEDEDEHETTIFHDNEAIEGAKRRQAEHAYLTTLTNTVRTVADNELLRKTLRRAKEEEEARLKQRKPKFAQRLERLQREAKERADREKQAERGRRKAPIEPGRHDTDDSDREVEAINAAGLVKQYTDPSECLSWRSNPIRTALAAGAKGSGSSKATTNNSANDDDDEGEGEEDEDKAAVGGETLSQLADRLLTCNLGLELKPRPDGTKPTVAEVQDKQFSLLVEREVKAGRLPYRGPKCSDKQREKGWKRVIDPTTAHVRIKAAEQGLARARVVYDTPSIEKPPWYEESDELMGGKAKLQKDRKDRSCSPTVIKKELQKDRSCSPMARKKEPLGNDELSRMESPSVAVEKEDDKSWHEVSKKKGKAKAT